MNPARRGVAEVGLEELARPNPMSQRPLDFRLHWAMKQIERVMMSPPWAKADLIESYVDFPV